MTTTPAPTVLLNEVQRTIVHQTRAVRAYPKSYLVDRGRPNSLTLHFVRPRRAEAVNVRVDYLPGPDLYDVLVVKMNSRCEVEEEHHDAVDVEAMIEVFRDLRLVSTRG